LLEKESIPYLLYDHVYKNDKLKATGYELTYPDFKIGLRETVTWYREHGYIKT
jgi:hypothetical protein